MLGLAAPISSLMTWNDGTPNRLDTDSDEDGISDQVEGAVDTDNIGSLKPIPHVSTP